jgi:hypothetical protein
MKAGCRLIRGASRCHGPGLREDAGRVSVREDKPVPGNDDTIREKKMMAHLPCGIFLRHLPRTLNAPGWVMGR